MSTFVSSLFFDGPDQEVPKGNQIVPRQDNACSHDGFQFHRSIFGQASVIRANMRKCQSCQRSAYGNIDWAIANRFRNITWVY